MKVSYLDANEATSIFEMFKEMIDDGIDISGEIEEFKDAIKSINPIQIKEYFALKGNKKYYLPVFKEVITKYEGELKPSADEPPQKKKSKKYPKVNLVIEQPADEPSQKKISFDRPPVAKMTLKERQKIIQDKIKEIESQSPEIEDEYNLEIQPVVPFKDTDLFDAYYNTLKLKPADRTDQTLKAIKFFENEFITRGFTPEVSKILKKKIANSNIQIPQYIRKKIENPVVPESSPGDGPEISQTQTPKKKGRPPKKKIPIGSNKLVLLDNIIKKHKEVGTMLKNYFDYEYENS
jgi:hypothetical protein